MNLLWHGYKAKVWNKSRACSEFDQSSLTFMHMINLYLFLKCKFQTTIMKTVEVADMKCTMQCEYGKFLSK